MTMIFEDHFDGIQLNTNRWKQEGDYKQCIDVSNSILHIRGKLINGSPSWTGMRTSTAPQPFTFKYGFLEIRAKIDRHKGVRNQMWGQVGPDPGNSWDMETGVSTGTYNPGGCKNRYKDGIVLEVDASNGNAKEYCFVDVTNLSDDFHLYQMEWTPTYMAYKIDGIEKARFTKYIPQVPLPINLAMCLGQCGLTWSHNINIAELPFDFQIDYIRVYSENIDGCSNPLVTFYMF